MTDTRDFTEEARERFFGDCFATKTTGAEVLESKLNFARCQLVLKDCHMNAMHNPMGGVIYTLADFAFAIAANMGNAPTVSMNTYASFYKVAKGDVLYSEATLIDDDGKDCNYLVKVTDDTGILVADVKVHGRRLKAK